MADLRVQVVDSEAAIEDWRFVHNTVVPAAALSLDEVRERVPRHRLEVAYQGGVLVGCTTVRPAAGPEATSVVIVRVLAEHRGQGFGTQLYGRASAAARALGAERIETVVWEPNVDGLRFAEANGFVEVSRYLPPDEDVAYLTMRLR